MSYCHMLTDHISISFSLPIDCQMCFSIHWDYNKKWVLSLLVSLLAVAFFIGLVIKHKDTKKDIQGGKKGEETYI